MTDRNVEATKIVDAVSRALDRVVPKSGVHHEQVWCILIDWLVGIAVEHMGHASAATVLREAADRIEKGQMYGARN